MINLRSGNVLALNMEENPINISHFMGGPWSYICYPVVKNNYKFLKFLISNNILNNMILNSVKIISVNFKLFLTNISSKLMYIPSSLVRTLVEKHCAKDSLISTEFINVFLTKIFIRIKLISMESIHSEIILSKLNFFLIIFNWYFLAQLITFTKNILIN